MSRIVKLTAIAAIVLAIILFVLFWHGSTEPIKAEMNKFHPDASWQLESETFKPPSIICLEGHCPYAQRTWVTDKFVPASELKRLMDAAGWKGELEGACPEKADTSSEYRYNCHSGFKTSNNYHIDIYLSDHSDNTKLKEITIFINAA